MKRALCCKGSENPLYWRGMELSLQATAPRLSSSTLLAGLLLRVRAR